jgi:toxin FitB
MFLLDTNVVSELRKPKPHGAVLAWIEGVNDDDLFLSAVTIGEVQRGIELARKQGDDKAREIEAWLDIVASSYNVLPMDSETFRMWARIMHKTSEVLIQAAMIAATAINHELTVVTRNVSDFKSFKVPTLNPFTA